MNESATDPHGLSGQNVVVVGGAGLIGAAICEELLSRRMDVIAVDRDEDAVARLESRSGRVRTSILDITRAEDSDRLEQLFDAAATQHLVLSQGFRNRASRKRPLAHVEWLEMADVNLIAPTHVANMFSAHLAARGMPGSIIALSSVHARLLIGDPSYSASKAGLEMVVRELARAGAPHRIRVNAVAPGHVGIDSSGDTKPSWPTPFGRKTIRPDAIATAVRFLLCEHCSPSTTGVTLTVDAGMSLFAPWKGP